MSQGNCCQQQTVQVVATMEVSGSCGKGWACVVEGRGPCIVFEGVISSREVASYEASPKSMVGVLILFWSTLKSNLRFLRREEIDSVAGVRCLDGETCGEASGSDSTTISVLESSSLASTSNFSSSSSYPIPQRPPL